MIDYVNQRIVFSRLHNFFNNYLAWFRLIFHDAILWKPIYLDFVFLSFHRLSLSQVFVFLFFQSFTIDDVEMADNLFSAKLHRIFCQSQQYLSPAFYYFLDFFIL